MKDKIKELKNKLKHYFFFGDDVITPISQLTSFDNIDSSFQSIFLSFIENIESIGLTAKLPLTMSSQRAKMTIYERIRTREFILSAPLVTDLPESEEQEQKRQISALEKAQKDFFKNLETEDGKNELIFITLEFLDALMTSSTFERTAQELLNQSVLSIWTIFEVLCRDIFVVLINQNKKLVENILEVPSLKQKFNLKTIPTETLLKYNYDLSNHMGDILLDNFEFSNIDVIRTLYKTIFNDKSLNQKLESNDLWLLFKRRNLLVHKGGVVDQQYISCTSDVLELKTKMYIKPNEIYKYLELVKDIAIALKAQIEKLNEIK